uniref:Uncharacterized protein n=1 Tax=viral metagenome TaxID=1070528 RepID=A0A6H1ZZY0_9ZZZZ
MEEFPLYPELSEEGKQEAQRLIDAFKEKLKKAAVEVIGDLYCDAADFIESDSWSNFRNTVMDGFRNYNNRKLQARWDFAEIRAAIFKQFRDEIIPELNQDLVKENEKLKKDVERLNGWLEECRRY